MNSRSLQGLSAALLLGLLAAGCDRTPPAEGEVTGRVLYNGKPLPWGNVTFLAADGTKVPTVIEKDGRYQLSKLPVGSYKIGVISRETPPPIPPHSERPNSKAPTPGKNPFNISERYGKPETSGLTYEVREGPQVHDILLLPQAP
jgi:hypothetical protein